MIGPLSSVNEQRLPPEPARVGPAALQIERDTENGMLTLLATCWIVKAAKEIHEKQKKIPLVLPQPLTFSRCAASKSKWRAEFNASGTCFRTAALMRLYIGYSLLIVWLCASAPVRAQDAERNPLPLPVVTAEDLPADWSLSLLSLAQSPNAQPASTQTQPPNPQSQQQDKQSGQQQQKTSNDRLFWALPNFLTLENAANVPPLTAKEKFKVTARGLFDPSEFVLTGFVAGLGQAANSNPSYGQGMQGYGKRYGTAYGDNFVENFMASAIFPSLLHQDPRYYELGHGGFFRRTAHAIGRILITRSDSGHTQVNFSELGGAFAAASISTYTYHPSSERGIGNVVSVWGTQMSWDAATYVLKEFWPDLRKLSKKKNSGVSSVSGKSQPSTAQ
jgi:hypothetical protein